MISADHIITFPIWRCLSVKHARRYCLFIYIVISAAPRSASQHGGHALVTTEVNLAYRHLNLFKFNFQCLMLHILKHNLLLKM